METLDKAHLCHRILTERKAVDPVLLEVGELTSIADFFLIVSGHSTRQVQSLARHLQSRLRDMGIRPYGVEGEREGHWVLMDCGDVVIHIFYHPFREFYDLEGLWTGAPRIAPDGREEG